MASYLKASRKNTDSNAAYALISAIELSLILVLTKIMKPKGTFTVDKKKYKIFSTEEAKDILKAEKKKLEERLDNDNMNYWDMQEFLSINFCLLMINEDEQTEHSKWEAIANNYEKSWNKAGSEGKKLSKLEHLKFLIYVLQKALNEKTSKFLAYNYLKNKCDLKAT